MALVPLGGSSSLPTGDSGLPPGVPDTGVGSNQASPAQQWMPAVQVGLGTAGVPTDARGLITGRTNSAQATAQNAGGNSAQTQSPGAQMNSQADAATQAGIAALGTVAGAQAGASIGDALGNASGNDASAAGVDANGAPAKASSQAQIAQNEANAKAEVPTYVGGP